MGPYLCYVHHAASMTPDCWVMDVGLDDLPAALLEAMAAWPDFEVIDIYDGRNQSVLKLSAHEELRLH